MILKRCNMRDFAESIGEKHLVCYGIGKEFDQIIKCYEGYGWIEKIAYLADNSPDKRGRKISVQDKSYRIMNLEDLASTGDKKLVIMPTCEAFADIIDCLNGISQFSDIECYVFHCMFNMSEGRLKIRRTGNIRIPPIIHYCWFGGKPLPYKYKCYIESWRKFCPNYEIKEWNESNIDISETKFTQEAYETGKYGFVPDYFRLKIIYENGGIYLDTDVELIRNLDDLRYNESFCGMEYPGKTAFGLGFGAEKHNPIIRKLMEFYENASFLKDEDGYNDIPSPDIQTKCLVGMGMKNKAVYQCFNGLSVYPVDVLSPKNPYTGELLVSENTYSVHHFDGTWLSKNGRDERRIKLEKNARLLNYLKKGERL